MKVHLVWMLPVLLLLVWAFWPARREPVPVADKSEPQPSKAKGMTISDEWIPATAFPADSRGWSVAEEEKLRTATEDMKLSTGPMDPVYACVSSPGRILPGQSLNGSGIAAAWCNVTDKIRLNHAALDRSSAVLQAYLYHEGFHCQDPEARKGMRLGGQHRTDLYASEIRAHGATARFLGKKLRQSALSLTDQNDLRERLREAVALRVLYEEGFQAVRDKRPSRIGYPDSVPLSTQTFPVFFKLFGTRFREIVAEEKLEQLMPPER